MGAEKFPLLLWLQICRKFLLLLIHFVWEGAFGAFGFVMNGQQIIMNFSMPPSLEDLEVMAADIVEGLPDELLEFCESLVVRLEDLAEESVEQELDLDDPYDLVVLYRSGKEISPGVERKTANDDDVLIVYRRPLLDLWCETGEDIHVLFRQTIIEELGRHFEFVEDEIEEMAARHFQGLL